MNRIMQPECTVVVADAARARVFQVEYLTRHDNAACTRLREVADAVHPERRHRPSALLSDNRSGMRRTAGRRAAHSVDSYANGPLEEGDRRFASSIAAVAREEMKRAGSTRAILAASPHMLGLLRAQQVAPDGVDVTELPKELTGLSASGLHDYLEKASLLPF